MSRLRIIAAGVGLLIAGIAAFVLLRPRKSERGFIIAFQTVDANTAIIVWRNNPDEGPSRSWVSRVSGDGHELWTRSIPAVAQSVGATQGLVIAGDAVVVRYSHTDKRGFRGIDHAASAFALSDGRPMWDRVLTAFQPRSKVGDGDAEPHLATYVSDIAVGKHVLEVANTGNETVLVGIDAVTGAEAWTQPYSDFLYAPLVVGDTLFAHYVDQTTLVDATTGTPRTVLTYGTGCAIGSEYLTILRDDNQPSLVAITPGMATPRVIASPFRPIEGDMFMVSCGRYGERLVFLLDGAMGSKTYVVVTDRTGQVLHRIELAYDLHSDGPTPMTKVYPAFASLGGELTRFVPYVMSSASGSRSRPEALIMLDLETGTIAWRGFQDEQVIFGSLFRAGTRWVWSTGQLAPTVAVFDGTTGKLVAAVEAYSYHGIPDIRPSDAAGDTLWIYSGDWSTFDRSPIAVLDLATLAPRFVRTIKITDATAAMKKRLGL